jgi:hypothetical protein
MTALTAEELRKVYHYDPETGCFMRKVRSRGVGVYKSGYTCPRGYVYYRVFGKKYLAHRLAWLYVHGSFPSKDIDHKNLKKSDNRIANLRLATKSQNSANCAPRGQTGFKGVIRVRNAWQAGITIKKKYVYLGKYETPEMAHEAYKIAALRTYGEFARMSHPDKEKSRV